VLAGSRLHPTDLPLDLDTFPPLLLEDLTEDPRLEEILLLASSNDLLASAPASIVSVSWVKEASIVSAHLDNMAYFQYCLSLGGMLTLCLSSFRRPLAGSPYLDLGFPTGFSQDLYANAEAHLH
jgi:hypothetical protein